MYLDNSLNKLLPSCLLLPLLLRVISVLIVFLSIRSHCFSGLFLCCFLSTKINYKHPPEQGTRDIRAPERGVCHNVCLGARHFRAFGWGHGVFQHHSSNWMLEVPPNPMLYYFSFGYLSSWCLATFSLTLEIGSTRFNVSIPFIVRIQLASQFMVNTTSCCLICDSQASDKPTFPGWLSTFRHVENTAAEQDTIMGANKLCVYEVELTTFYPCVLLHTFNRKLNWHWPRKADQLDATLFPK